jgi:Matrixin
MRVFLTVLVFTLALSTSACTDIGWEGDIHTLVPQGARSTWPDSIQRAAGAWSDRLERVCQRRVFIVTEPRIASESEHPVQLIAPEKWDQPKLGAYTTDRLIRVKDAYDDLTEQRILMHELGHALGADHVTDRPSIMNDSVQSDITREDVAMIAELAGCECPVADREPCF